MLTATQRVVLSTVLGISLLSRPIITQELTDTLKKIKDTGVITLKHRESSIPFSYYNDKQQVIDYSQEMMLKAIDAIVKERMKT